MALLFKISFSIIILILLSIFFSPSSIKAAFKGAPFLPTPKSIIRKALKSANLKQGEKLYDLGCGTGRVLIIGVKEFGADATGIEYSTPLFILSKINLFLHKIKKGRVYKKDFLETNIKLSEADVVFMFLTPKAFPKLKDKFNKNLKTGTRVITFSSPLLFWQPEKIIPLKERKNKINLYLYVKK